MSTKNSTTSDDTIGTLLVTRNRAARLASNSVLVVFGSGSTIFRLDDSHVESIF